METTEFKGQGTLRPPLNSNNYINTILVLIVCLSFCRERKIAQTLMAIGFNRSHLLTQYYDLDEKKWSPLEDIPLICELKFSCGAFLNGEFYYSNGQFPEKHLSSCNPTSRQSSILYSSNNILSSSALCTYGNHGLYLCGGFDKHKNKSNQVFKYDLMANSVATLPPMSTERAGACATFYQECLYVLGGWKTGQPLKLVEKYDPKTNKWTSPPSMREARHFHSAAVLDGKLYVCRGLDNNRAEAYDSSTNSWQQLASMEKTRANFFVLAHKGKLLALGGDEVATVEVYDPKHNKWQLDDQLSVDFQIQHPQAGSILLGSISIAK